MTAMPEKLISELIELPERVRKGDMGVHTKDCREGALEPSLGDGMLNSS
jgi:hypothetical protein